MIRGCAWGLYGLGLGSGTLAAASWWLLGERSLEGSLLMPVAMLAGNAAWHASNLLTAQAAEIATLRERLTRSAS
jgi:hypothetical protein